MDEPSHIAALRQSLEEMQELILETARNLRGLMTKLGIAPRTPEPVNRI